MSWATLYFLHPQVSCSGADRYTIIPCFNTSAGDSNTSGALNMNAVCVRTEVRCYDHYIFHHNIRATVNHDMHQLAVD